MASDVYVNFGGDASQLQAALAETSKSVAIFAGQSNDLARQLQQTARAADQDFNGALSAVSSHVRDVSASAGEAALSLDDLEQTFLRLAAVAGVSLSVDALKNWAQEVIKTGDQLDQQAAKYGLSLHTIQTLNGVGAITGASGGELVSGLFALQVELKRSQANAEETAAAFKAIGLSFNQMRGKSPLDLLEAIAGGMAKFADGAGRAAPEWSSSKTPFVAPATKWTRRRLRCSQTPNAT